MICLIRHGETDWNYFGKLQGETDIPLNDTGKSQAKKCRDHFKGSDWDVIVSSPLTRAKQTAEIINENLKLEIIEMDEFRERSFGEAEGLTIEERNRFYPSRVYPGQESRQAVIDRVLLGLDKINQQYAGKKVLLVAHGAVISTILSELSNGELGSKVKGLLNACISNIEYMEDKWKIHNYNQVDHLNKTE